MNESIKNMVERRSIRGYKDQQITEEQLRDILTAGEYAPSGMGGQDTVMVVVQSKEVMRRLSQMNAAVMGRQGDDPFYGAPEAIVVFEDAAVPTHPANGALVMGNLLNAAHSVGVDSCWIHRAKEVFESDEGKKMMSDWGVPAGYIGTGFCILGYRSGEYPTAAARKDGRIIRVR